MSAGQQRRRERERRARAAAAGGLDGAGAQAAQQLSEDLARERAVIELSRLRQVVFGWMSEFQAQHGRQPSVQETQERNPGAAAGQRAPAMLRLEIAHCHLSWAAGASSSSRALQRAQLRASGRSYRPTIGCLQVMPREIAGLAVCRAPRGRLTGRGCFPALPDPCQ